MSILGPKKGRVKGRGKAGKLSRVVEVVEIWCKEPFQVQRRKENKLLIGSGLYDSIEKGEKCRRKSQEKPWGHDRRGIYTVWLCVGSSSRKAESFRSFVVITPAYIQQYSEQIPAANRCHEEVVEVAKRNEKHRKKTGQSITQPCSPRDSYLVEGTSN